MNLLLRQMGGGVGGDQFIQVTDSTDRRAILAFIRDRVAKQRP